MTKSTAQNEFQSLLKLNTFDIGLVRNFIQSQSVNSVDFFQTHPSVFSEVLPYFDCDVFPCRLNTELDKR